VEGLKKSFDSTKPPLCDNDRRVEHSGRVTLRGQPKTE
jgi:hypothetical protein